MGSVDISQAGQLMFRCQLTLKEQVEGDPGLEDIDDSVCWFEVLTQDKAGVLWLLFWVSVDTSPSSQCWRAPREA